MFTGRTDLLRRFQLYADRNGLTVERQLGFGVHGIVFSAFHQPEIGAVAVKVHERGPDYVRERDVYLRLRANGVTAVRGCGVPAMIAFDDDLWVIEMTVVERPFLLDFAGAFLDQPPDFSDEVLADWIVDKRDQFGARWPEAQAVVHSLERYGIFMIDVNPGNVSFGN